MTTDSATYLLKQIGTFVGIDNLEFDAEGYCILQLQDQFAFIITVDQTRQRLVIIAEFATPKDISSELFSSILSFNSVRIAHSGPWIALDENTKAFLLADEFFVSLTDPAAFEERLIQFFDQYLSCQDLLNGETVETILENQANHHDNFNHQDS